MLISFNADLVLVILFLIITLAIGLWYGKETISMQDYALGGRRFSTTALTATLIATYISGSVFSFVMSETYTVGILALNNIGGVIGLCICGYILVPRMQEFLGKLSVAEVMGDLYGKHIRIITAICSIMISASFIAAQIKVFSSIFNYFFGIHSIHATIISSVIVIIYSAFGGIRAVVFTDIFQFLTFGAFIPTFALLVWSVFGNFEAVTTVLTTNPMFDPKLLLDYHNPTVLTYYGVFLYCLVPYSPAMFQRILIAQNVQQVSTSFKISAIIYLLFSLFTAFIGIVLLSVDSDIKASNLVMYIVDSYSLPGLKALVITGIAAMIMSTADSCINAAAVILVNDLCKPLGLLQNSQSRELGIIRIFAILIGFIALVMALSKQKLLDIVLLGGSFYSPIVEMPLLITILGFRSSTRVILSGIIAGITTTIIWDKYFEPSFPIGSIMPASIINFIVMMIVHYTLKEPGGWVGPKDRRPLDIIKIRRQDRKREILKFFELLQYRLRWDHIIHYCYNNSFLERHHYIYFAALSSLSLMIMLVVSKANCFPLFTNSSVITFFMLPSFIVATAFSMYKLWPKEFCRKYIGLIWHIDVFYSLVFVNTILLFIGKLAQAPSIYFLLNLMIVWNLIKWYIALPMMIIGIPLGALIFKTFNNYHNFSPIMEASLEFTAAYIILVIIGIVLIFLKFKRNKHNSRCELLAIEENNIAEFDQTSNNKITDIRILLNIRKEILNKLNDLSYETKKHIVELKTGVSLLPEPSPKY